jgi:hypothetical protein
MRTLLLSSSFFRSGYSIGSWRIVLALLLSLGVSAKVQPEPQVSSLSAAYMIYETIFGEATECLNKGCRTIAFAITVSSSALHSLQM